MLSAERKAKEVSDEVNQGSEARRPREETDEAAPAQGLYTVVVDGLTIVTNSILEDKTATDLLQISDESDSNEEEKGAVKITPAKSNPTRNIPPQNMNIPVFKNRPIQVPDQRLFSLPPSAKQMQSERAQQSMP